MRRARDARAVIGALVGARSDRIDEIGSRTWVPHLAPPHLYLRQPLAKDSDIAILKLEALLDETRKQSARGMVAESLKAAIELLGRLEETADVRELRARALGYITTVATWEKKRPTHDELSAMIKQVEALQSSLETARQGAAGPANES